MTRKDFADTPPGDTAEMTAATQGIVTLVLQDDGQDGDLSAEVFQTAGCHALFVTEIADALDLLTSASPVLVIMPVLLNGRKTLPFLAHCKAQPSEPQIVVIATNDQINDAAEAMHEGASDCLFQPFNTARLTQVIRDSLAQRPVASEAPTPSLQSTETEPMPFPVSLSPASNTTNSPPPRAAKAPSHPVRPPAQAGSRGAKSNLLGTHPNFQSALQTLESVAHSTAPVLLQGEMGTGKEQFARALHEMSGRPKDRFVVVDCAALRPDTVAQEIFGTDEAVAPNAARAQAGAAQRADGGTLYFDEIAHLDPRAQQQLVRFLRSGQIHPVGAAQPRDVDIRIVSASSRDPIAMIDSGDLLKDLYYQLHVASIPLPPLKDRGDDILLLAAHFLARYSETETRSFTGFTPDALAALRQHAWPGNVSELKNVIWNAVLQHDGDKMTREMLPAGLGVTEPLQPPTPAPGGPGFNSLVGRSLAEIEQVVIEETIRAYQGSIPKAARALGVSPSTIYRKRENWQS